MRLGLVNRLSFNDSFHTLLYSSQCFNCDLNGYGALDPKLHIVLYPTTILMLVLGTGLALLPRSNATPPMKGRLTAVMRSVSAHHAWSDVAFMSLLLALCVLSVSSGTYSPFLYFRF